MILRRVADVLVAIGVLTITVAVVGPIRMPDIYTRLHAAAKAPVVGVIVILLASVGTGEPAVIARAALITILIAITTVASAHAIGWAAYVRGEPMAEGSVDLSEE